MKKMLHFTLCTVCSFSAWAIPLQDKNRTRTIQQHITAYQTILQNQSRPGSTAKTTAPVKKLTSTAYVANGTPGDSNRFYYSGSRGCTLIKPDSYVEDFDLTDENPKQTLAVDSAITWSYLGAGYARTKTKNYKYDANNNPTYGKLAMTGIYFEYASAYNSGNHQTSVTVSDTLGSGSFAPKTRMYITYNAQNKRAKDSTTDLTTSGLIARRLYTYDGNGNLLSTVSYYVVTVPPIQLFSRVTNTYDASNRLLTTISEYDMGSGLENFLKDSFAYTGTSTDPSYHRSYNWDAATNKWLADKARINHYNAQGFIDVYYQLTYTSKWDTTEKDVYTYDADNLILRLNGYNYLSNGNFSSTPYDQTTMHYDEPANTGINMQHSVPNKFILYPNPASNSITLTATTPQTGNVAIYNSTGMVITNITAINLNNQQIDISNYPPGIYAVSVTDSSGVSLYRVTFSKL